MSTWAYSIPLLTILVAHLHMWAEQATIILMPIKGTDYYEKKC